MQKSFWKPAAGWVLFSLGLGGLASLLTLKGLKAFDTMAKPPLTPPQIVFPIAWSILLILIGLGHAIARDRAANSSVRDAASVAYAVQAVFFFCWMIWFFGLGWYGFSALWLAGLILSVLAMMRAFRRISKLAACLQIPYLLWCCFALYLNIGVWRLNG